MTAAQLLTRPLAHHGEGPVWVAGDASLYWVDMLAGDVLQLDGEGRVSRHHVGSVAAALRPRVGGGLVVAVERGFALVEPDWTMRVLPEAFADQSVRMNDGGCDPQGRFYCGTMAYDAAQGAGTLFRLDPDESVHVVLDGVTVSNGLAWSPDGTTAYYVDSATQRIDAFDFDGGSARFQHRRPVVTIDQDLGSPDGLTVDAEGGLWVALWDGAAVHRYSPEGRLTEVIELPTPRVTACTFGGERLDQLFITTSAFNLTGNHEPAGAVFLTEPGVAGLPAGSFAALAAPRSDMTLNCKTICLTVQGMADTITIRTDDETEHALDVLTHGGISRSAAIRQAVLEAASRRERAAQLRREVLRMELGEPDGVNVADELARDRSSER